jgi:hypothetical protein
MADQPAKLSPETAAKLIIHAERQAQSAAVWTIAAAIAVTLGSLALHAHFVGIFWLVAVVAIGSCATGHPIARASRLAPAVGLPGVAPMTAIGLALVFPAVAIVGLYGIAHVHFGGVYVIPQVMEWNAEFAGTKRWALLGLFALVMLWSSVQLVLLGTAHAGQRRH